MYGAGGVEVVGLLRMVYEIMMSLGFGPYRLLYTRQGACISSAACLRESVLKLHVSCRWCEPICWVVQLPGHKAMYLRHSGSDYIP